MRGTAIGPSLFTACALLLAACGGGGGGGGLPAARYDADGTWIFLREPVSSTNPANLSPGSVGLVDVSQDGVDVTLLPRGGVSATAKAEGATYTWRANTVSGVLVVEETGSFTLSSEDRGTGTILRAETAYGSSRGTATIRLTVARLRAATFDATGRFTLAATGNTSTPAGRARPNRTEAVSVAQAGNAVGIDTATGPLSGYASGAEYFLAGGAARTGGADGRSETVRFTLSSRDAGSGSWSWAAWDAASTWSGTATLGVARGEILGNLVFAGDYVGSGFGGTAATGAASFFGGLAADGTGGTARAGTRNEQGTLVPVDETATSSVGTDGTLTLSAGAFRGGIAWDGRAAVAGAVAVSSAPWFEVLIRPGGTFGAGALSGPYHAFAASAPAGAPAEVSWGSFQADGAGNASFLEMVTNSGGTIGGPTAGSPDSYAVTPEGRLTLAGALLEGGIERPGGIAVLSGATNDGGAPRFAILLPKSTAASTATLNGEYWAAGIRVDAGDGSFTSFTGEMSADGAGVLAWISRTDDAEGVIAAGGGTEDYTVRPEGLIFASDVAGAEGGPFLTGAVTPDGRFAVLAGEVGAGRPPLLLVLVRK